MIVAFCRYFASHILLARHRQWPLILAALGLTLSSFTLIFLQSTMSGFQANQIERSKESRRLCRHQYPVPGRTNGSGRPTRFILQKYSQFSGVRSGTPYQER